MPRQTGRGVVARLQKHRERHRSQSAAMQNCRKVQRYILATASAIIGLPVFVQRRVTVLEAVHKVIIPAVLTMINAKNVA